MFRTNALTNFSSLSCLFVCIICCKKNLYQCFSYIISFSLSFLLDVSSQAVLLSPSVTVTFSFSLFERVIKGSVILFFFFICHGIEQTLHANPCTDRLTVKSACVGQLTNFQLAFVLLYLDREKQFELRD